MCVRTSTTDSSSNSPVPVLGTLVPRPPYSSRVEQEGLEEPAEEEEDFP